MPQPAANLNLKSAEPFNPTVTTFAYPWPKEITPLERIILAASGDLQRMLSAFFALPITIDLVFSHTSPPDRPPSFASPSSPIIQKRQVHLLCEGRTVCIATSSVTITSPECARLFLEEKYAIGQLFRAVGTVPKFALLKVGLRNSSELRGEDTIGSEAAHKQKSVMLWRRYTLEVEGIACEIVEVFPDRDMFNSFSLHPGVWLGKQPVQTSQERTSQALRFLNSLEDYLPN